MSTNDFFIDYSNIKNVNYERGIDVYVDLQVQDIRNQALDNLVSTENQNTHDIVVSDPVDVHSEQILPRPQNIELGKLVQRNPKWVKMLGISEEDIEESSSSRKLRTRQKK